MRKILVLGDYQDAPYHPLGAVEGAIQEILGEGYDLTFTADYNVLCSLEEYDLFLCYADCWKHEEPITDAQAGGLFSYVAKGGRFVVLHCGLSLQIRPELISLMGGKFFAHPPKDDIFVKATCPTDPITKGVAAFVSNEEPYCFEFDPYSDITVIAEYLYKGKTYPHSWKKRFGMGEVVFLMGGHTEENMRETGNVALLKNTVEYLLQEK